MMHRFHEIYEDYELEGIVDIEPSEPATQIDPAYPAIATLLEVFINGSKHNAIEILSPALIHMIEQKIAEEY